jgi:hypothetical protein
LFIKSITEISIIQHINPRGTNLAFSSSTFVAENLKHASNPQNPTKSILVQHIHYNTVFHSSETPDHTNKPVQIINVIEGLKYLLNFERPITFRANLPIFMQAKENIMHFIIEPTKGRVSYFAKELRNRRV